MGRILSEEMNCLNCSYCPDSEENMVSINALNEFTGRRELMKLFELTKIDHQEGFLCQNCDKLVQNITKLEIELLKIRANGTLGNMGNYNADNIKTFEENEEFPESVMVTRNFRNPLVFEKSVRFKSMEYLNAEMDLDDLEEEVEIVPIKFDKQIENQDSEIAKLNAS